VAFPTQSSKIFAMADFGRITVLDWARRDDRWRTIEVIHKKSRRGAEETQIGLDCCIDPQ
jgi:hypothetical protein